MSRLIWPWSRSWFWLLSIWVLVLVLVLPVRVLVLVLSIRVLVLVLSYWVLNPSLLYLCSAVSEIKAEFTGFGCIDQRIDANFDYSPSLVDTKIGNNNCPPYLFLCRIWLMSVHIGLLYDYVKRDNFVTFFYFPFTFLSFPFYRAMIPCNENFRKFPSENFRKFSVNFYWKFPTSTNRPNKLRNNSIFAYIFTFYRLLQHLCALVVTLRHCFCD